MVQGPEGTHEKARPGEQHERERHLAHHEQRPQPTAAPHPHGAPSRFADRARQVGPAEGEHRCQAEEQAAAERSGEVEEERGGVHDHLLGTREAVAGELHHQVGPVKGDGETSQAPQDAQQKALGQQLA